MEVACHCKMEINGDFVPKAYDALALGKPPFS